MALSVSFLDVDKILRRLRSLLVSSAHFLGNYVQNCSTVAKLKTILQLLFASTLSLIHFIYIVGQQKSGPPEPVGGGCVPTRHRPPSSLRACQSLAIENFKRNLYRYFHETKNGPEEDYWTCLEC